MPELFCIFRRSASICFAALIALLLSMTGCGGAADFPGIQYNDSIYQYSQTRESLTFNRNVIGVYDLLINPSSSNPVSIIPSKDLAFHMNIRTFLEESPCSDCLKLKSFNLTAVGFDLEITIVHPFPSLPKMPGFDVRGIMFMEGSMIFPNSGIIASSPSLGDSYVINPDGYTTLFNPSEYSGKGILHYSKGKLLPKQMPDPSATLGAYKAFYSEGQSEAQGGRRAFLVGDSVTRTFKIAHAHGVPLRIGYAIDACWEPPLNNPPINLDDFPPSANCPEPYRIDIDVIENNLMTDCGSLKLEITAYDHQGNKDLGICAIEAPGLSNAVYVDDSPLQIGAFSVKYQVEIFNEYGEADPKGEAILVKINHGGNDPNLGNTPAWFFKLVPISIPPENPVIQSIYPNFGFQGSNVKATIYGSGFKPNLIVNLYQGMNVLQGYDIKVLSSCELKASFDLNGPIGKYTVYVENPNNLWGELPDAFTMMKSVSNCLTDFHKDTLGSGIIPGLITDQYDCAFLTKGNFAGMMIAARQFLWGIGMVAVDVDTISPPDPILLPGLLGNTNWKIPWTIDVDEATGNIFITWVQKKGTVDVYNSSGGLVISIPLGDVVVSGLDSDGDGGFWVTYSNISSTSVKVDHYLRDPVTGWYAIKPSDSFSLLPVYAAIQDIAVLPKYRMFILCAPNNGTILSWDLSTSPPELSGLIDNVFDSPMLTASDKKAGDIDIDQTDYAMAPCRIVAFTNRLQSGSMVVKLDSNLNILNSITLNKKYQASAVNPDSDPAKHHLVLFPQNDNSAEFRLLETPSGW